MSNDMHDDPFERLKGPVPAPSAEARRRALARASSRGAGGVELFSPVKGSLSSG